MAKVNVDKSLFWDPATGETKVGYRHPVTHQIIFEDADSVDVEDVGALAETLQNETEEVQVDDPRFENLPEADTE